MASSYPPPPPPPPPPISNGQSPGGPNTLPHPNSNSENNSPITSQASTSYIPTNTIVDESMVPTTVSTQYETLPGSSTTSSSRQVSPKVVAKPVAAARHNTTGMSIPAVTNGMSTTSGSHHHNGSTNNTGTTGSNSNSFLASAPSQRMSQPPPGFGKMLYFLDQMKLEVTEADQSIKHLQTEMKCLVRSTK